MVEISKGTTEEVSRSTLFNQLTILVMRGSQRKKRRKRNKVDSYCLLNTSIKENHSTKVVIYNKCDTLMID